MTSMAEKKRAKRGGRKLKQGVDRYPGGSIVHHQRGETAEQIMATAMAQPHRAPFENKADRLAGFASGRLLRMGYITKTQYQALERHTALAVAYSSRVIGRPLKYPALAIERADRSHASEEEDVRSTLAIEDEMGRANRALLDLGYTECEPAKRALWRVGVMDVDRLPPDEMGALRCGLNALARLWGLTESREIA